MKNETMKKKSWRDVTINEYFELVDRLNDDSLNDYDKIVIKLAFTNNCSEDDIWNLPINEFRNYQVESLWLEKFDLNQNVKIDKIKIGNETYNVNTIMQEFTVAQYIDFQTFYPKYKTDKTVLGNLLACFIIPKGNRYAEGYDIQQLVSMINENVDIMTAQEILFFFLKRYLISISLTAHFFNWQIRKMKKKHKKDPKLLKMEIQWEEAKKNILAGLRLSTMLPSLHTINGMTFSEKTSTNSSI